MHKWAGQSDDGNYKLSAGEIFQLIDQEHRSSMNSEIAANKEGGEIAAHQSVSQSQKKF